MEKQENLFSRRNRLAQSLASKIGGFQNIEFHFLSSNKISIIIKITQIFLKNHRFVNLGKNKITMPRWHSCSSHTPSYYYGPK
jgi:hypothetical protein